MKRRLSLTIKKKLFVMGAVAVVALASLSFISHSFINTQSFRKI